MRGTASAPRQEVFPQPPSSYRLLPQPVLVSARDCGSLTPSALCPLGTHFPPSPPAPPYCAREPGAEGDGGGGHGVYGGRWLVPGAFGFSGSRSAPGLCGFPMRRSVPGLCGFPVRRSVPGLFSLPMRRSAPGLFSLPVRRSVMEPLALSGRSARHRRCLFSQRGSFRVRAAAAATGKIAAISAWRAPPCRLVRGNSIPHFSPMRVAGHRQPPPFFYRCFAGFRAPGALCGQRGRLCVGRIEAR